MEDKDKRSCFTCSWNDDLLCDCTGVLIDWEFEKDTVCKYYKNKEEGDKSND